MRSPALISLLTLLSTPPRPQTERDLIVRLDRKGRHARKNRLASVRRRLRTGERVDIPAATAGSTRPGHDAVLHRSDPGMRNLGPGTREQASPHSLSPAP